MSKKVLITGNSGYIGSHLSKILQQTSEYEIHGLDRAAPKVSVDRYIPQDITWDNYWDTKDVYDCVIHLAAQVNVGASVQHPTLYYTTNLLGTLSVLNKIKTRNFILASTGAAAGLASPYGISKRAAEEVVVEYCNTNRIDYSIFRFYNVIGSDGIAPTNPDGLMLNLMRAPRDGFNLFGDDYNTLDGSCVRDYVHVNEICLALKQAIEEPSQGIENLGHGQGHTVKQMIEIFKQVNNCDFTVNVCARRPGDLEYSVLDNPSRYMQQIYSINDLLKI